MRSSKLNLISKADIASALNGLSGFVAIVLFIHNALVLGSVFVLLSIIFDGLDGILARKYGSRHGKGVQIDSIADTISFCVAPAIAIYSAFNTPDPYSPMSMLTVFASSAIVFTGIVRLGAFCDEGYALDYFNGLPTPGSALLIISATLLFRNDFQYLGPIMAIIASALMVLRIRYPKMKGRLEMVSGSLILFFMLAFALYYLGYHILYFSIPLAFLFSLGYLIFGPMYCHYRG